MWIDDIPTFLVALTPMRLAIWPALAVAAVTLAGAARDARRRTALNERLHELRRPLQTLALQVPPGGGTDRSGERDRSAAAAGAVAMAAAALTRLEAEVNGHGEGRPGRRAAAPTATIAVRPLFESAFCRWRPQATLAGRSLLLRWDGEEAAVLGDRIALAAALDNLLANALEHGGPRIELAADLVGGRICLAVVDSGREPGDPEREAGSRRDRRRRLSGRARRGHGLRLVRRTAAAHRGTFALHKGTRGTTAVLELPLAPSLRPAPSLRAPNPDHRPEPIRSHLGPAPSLLTTPRPAAPRSPGPGASQPSRPHPSSPDSLPSEPTR
jgi:signal transduction histidine kinase